MAATMRRSSQLRVPLHGVNASTMIERSRLKESKTVDGIHNIGGTVSTRIGTPTYIRRTSVDWTDKKLDVRGYLPVTPCNLFKERTDWTPVGFLNPNLPNLGLRWLKGACPTAAQTYGTTPSVSTLSAEQAVTMLLARTNPFRQEVDVPVLIVELMTMTSLLTKVKGSIVNGAGDLFLRKEFEIDPFMSDIAELDKILKTLSIRIREYNSLFGKGGLHRRVKQLHRGREVTTELSVPFHTSPSPVNVTGKVTKERVIRWSGTVRWFPKHGLLPQPDPIVKVRAILSEMFGLNPKNHGFSQLWELIPFSFLMDYFVNLNEILGSAKGRQFVTPRYITVSKLTMDTKVGVPTSYGNFSRGGEFRIGRHRLERTTFPDGYVGDAVFNGLLSEGQTKNLAALIAAMQKRV
jgi:hypothetical protein